MKTFSVLCATLSVIQVIFIGESTALEGQEYNPYNYITAPQYDGRFMRQPSAASRLEPQINYEGDNLLNSNLSRNIPFNRDFRYSRFNNNGMYYPKIEQQPYLSNSNPSLIGSAVGLTSNVLDNVQSFLGNQIENISRTADQATMTMSDLGNRATDGLIQTMDSGFKMPGAIGNFMTGVPGHLTGILDESLPNFLNYNNNKPYYNQFANERIEDEYIQRNRMHRPQIQYPSEIYNPLMQNEQDRPYYGPYSQQPITLPQRRISYPTTMNQPEIENIPTRYQKIPPRSTLEQPLEGAIERVAPLPQDIKEEESIE